MRGTYNIKILCAVCCVLGGSASFYRYMKMAKKFNTCHFLYTSEFL